MSGNKVAFKCQLQNLGAMMDEHLSWMPHVDMIQEKAFKMIQVKSRLSAANWSLGTKIRKMLYSLLAEQVILNAASI